MSGLFVQLLAESSLQLLVGLLPQDLLRLAAKVQPQTDTIEQDVFDQPAAVSFCAQDAYSRQAQPLPIGSNLTEIRSFFPTF